MIVLSSYFSNMIIEKKKLYNYFDRRNMNLLIHSYYCFEYLKN
jgi:hypothetical protein